MPFQARSRSAFLLRCENRAAPLAGQRFHRGTILVVTLGGMHPPSELVAQESSKTRTHMQTIHNLIHLGYVCIDKQSNNTQIHAHTPHAHMHTPTHPPTHMCGAGRHKTTCSRGNRNAFIYLFFGLFVCLFVLVLGNLSSSAEVRFRPSKKKRHFVHISPNSFLSVFFSFSYRTDVGVAMTVGVGGGDGGGGHWSPTSHTAYRQPSATPFVGQKQRQRVTGQEGRDPRGQGAGQAMGLRKEAQGKRLAAIPPPQLEKVTHDARNALVKMEMTDIKVCLWVGGCAVSV